MLAHYWRIVFAGVGVCDALVFHRVGGAIVALMVIAIMDVFEILDDRARRKRATEDALHTLTAPEA